METEVAQRRGVDLGIRVNVGNVGLGKELCGSTISYHVCRGNDKKESSMSVPCRVVQVDPYLAAIIHEKTGQASISPPAPC